MKLKTNTLLIPGLCTWLITAGPAVFAGDIPGAVSDVAAEAPTNHFSAEQLRSLTAPIALYPDELVSQILVATTYPLEVVQAYQWLQQHPGLKGQEVTQAATKQNWDPSIQALVAFPDVLKRLNQDITWTTNLGNAFLADQSSVMDAIQKLRGEAEQAGKLKSTDKERVTTTEDAGQRIVVIEPADPQVVYVPEYDPVWIWGEAPVYYPYPYWYYPPPPPRGIWISWGRPCRVDRYYSGWGGWNDWGWHPGWHDHTVVINNTFIRQNNFAPAPIVVNRTVTVNRYENNSSDFLNRRNVPTTSTVGVWQHNPEHRLGVSYPSRGLNQQFRPAVYNARQGQREIYHAMSPPYNPAARNAVNPVQVTRPERNAQQVQLQLRQAEIRGSQPSPPSARERIDNRPFNGTSYNAGNRIAPGAVEPTNNIRASAPTMTRPAFNANQVQEQLRQSQIRMGGSPLESAPDRVGNRQIQANVYSSGNHNAFGSVEPGNNARTNSSRGYQSLNRSPETATSRPSAPTPALRNGAPAAPASLPGNPNGGGSGPGNDRNGNDVRIGGGHR